MARGWRCLPDCIDRAQLRSIKRCRPRAGRRSPKSMRTNWLCPASWWVNGLGWWLLRLLRGLHVLRFCDEPQHHIYDIEESSLVLSHVVEPEDLTFAEDAEINDDAIFVQDDPFYDDHIGNYCCPPLSQNGKVFPSLRTGKAVWWRQLCKTLDTFANVSLSDESGIANNSNPLWSVFYHLFFLAYSIW